MTGRPSFSNERRESTSSCPPSLGSYILPKQLNISDKSLEFPLLNPYQSSRSMINDIIIDFSNICSKITPLFAILKFNQFNLDYNSLVFGICFANQGVFLMLIIVYTFLKKLVDIKNASGLYLRINVAKTIPTFFKF